MTDASKIVENLLLYCNAVDNATANLKQNLKKLLKSEKIEYSNSILEELFNNLPWKDENGAKLGPYQTTTEQDNNPEKWKKAYDILNTKKATISSRFPEKTFQHSYWLFDKTEYKIFRQRLKEASR